MVARGVGKYKGALLGKQVVIATPCSSPCSCRTTGGGGRQRRLTKGGIGAAKQRASRRARAAHAHRDPVDAGAPDVPAGQRRDARAPRALGPGARDGRDARRGGGEREHRGRCTARHEVVRREGRRAMRQRERGDDPPLSRSLRTAPERSGGVTDRVSIQSAIYFIRETRPPMNDSSETIDSWFDRLTRTRNGEASLRSERLIAHGARRAVAERERLAVRGATSRALHRG